jgi:hypothetical protein
VYVRNSYGPASGGTRQRATPFRLSLLIPLIHLCVSAVALLCHQSVFFDHVSSSVFSSLASVTLLWPHPPPTAEGAVRHLPPLNQPLCKS